MRDLEKKLNNKTKEYTDLRKEVERKTSEIDNFKDSLDKTHRKLVFKTEQMDKEIA